MTSAQELDRARPTYWAYDVFGYLMPGAVVVVCAHFANAYARSALPLGGTPSAIWLTELALLAYAAGHIVAAMSSRLLETHVMRRVGYPTNFMLEKPANHTPGRIGRALKLAACYKAVINGLQPGFQRAYTTTFQCQISRCIRDSTPPGLDPVTDADDCFWHAWELVALKHPIGFRRVTHLVELYGFARNTSMALLVVLVLVVLPGWAGPTSRWVWAALSLSTAVVLWGNYLKLLRRANDAVFRGFVASTVMDRPVFQRSAADAT